VLRFYGIADNLVIGNIIVVSQHTTGTCNSGAPIGVGNDARYRYSSALTVSSIAAGKDERGLTVANNVFVGATFLGGALAADKNNIFWSYSPTSEAVGFGDTASTLVRKLGTLDANNFFVNAGGDRGAGEHSAGPYEP
jgi:hypothetical protein